MNLESLSKAELEDEIRRLRAQLADKAGPNSPGTAQLVKNQQFLMRAGTLLASTLDYQVTLENLAHLAVPHLADWCVIDIIDEASGRIQSLGVAHSDPVNQEVVQELTRRYWTEFRSPDHILPRVLATGRSIVLSEPLQEHLETRITNPEHRRLLYQLGIKSLMAVPLLVREKVIGALMLVGAGRRNNFTQSELELAEELARRAATAIDNARLYLFANTELAERKRSEEERDRLLVAEQQARAQAERAAERTALLQRVTAALSGSVTQQEVAQVVIGQAVAAMGAYAGVVVTRTGQNELEIILHTGYDNGLLHRWHRFPLDSGVPISDTALTGQAVFLGSWTEIKAAYPNLDPADTGNRTRALATLPLEIGGTIIGAMGLSFENEYHLEDDDRAFMISLAQQCAQALERARLYETERAALAAAEAAHNRLAFLANASQALISSLDFQTSLEHLARLTLPALADYCVVDIIEDDSWLVRAAQAHSDPALEQLMRQVNLRHRLDKLGSLAITRVIRTGQTILITDFLTENLAGYARDQQHLELLEQLRPASALFVPLNAPDRVIGVLLLVMSESGRHFSAEDQTLAEELAQRAAVHIENTRLYRQTQEAVRLREEFLSVAAHELRTPLTSMRGYAQLANRLLAKQDELDLARLKRALEIITRQTDKLSNLVFQLLDISRLELGNLTLERQPTDLRSLAEEAAANMLITTGSHHLEVRGPAELIVNVDPIRIEQVLTNLLGNAVKYSPDGGLIEIILEGSVDGKVKICVTDQGIGVAPEHRPHIFERFYRADANDRTSGVGLGLYVSRQIILLHGGELVAEFPAEGGTHMIITLPA